MNCRHCKCEIVKTSFALVNGARHLHACAHNNWTYDHGHRAEPDLRANAREVSK